MIQVVYAELTAHGKPFIALWSSYDAILNPNSFAEATDFVSKKLFPEYSASEVVLIHKDLFGKIKFRGKPWFIQYLQSLSDSQWNGIQWMRATFSEN